MLYLPLVRLLLVLMILSKLSENVLNLALLPVLLLDLLYILHILHPSVQPPISADIIANTVIKLNIAELQAHGIKETN